MLDKTTFGNSPAALYLVEVLNEVDDPRFTRKLGGIISDTRRLMRAIENANMLNVFDSRVVGQMLGLVFLKLNETFSEDILQTAGIAITDDDWDACHLARNLTENICRGEYKQLARRLQQVRILEQSLARQTGKMQRSIDSYDIPLKIRHEPVTLDNVADVITSETLRDKSRAKLQRTGKPAKLY